MKTGRADEASSTGKGVWKEWMEEIKVLPNNFLPLLGFQGWQRARLGLRCCETATEATCSEYDVGLETVNNLAQDVDVHGFGD